MATTDYSTFKAQIWSAKINGTLETSCAMLQCVNRDYQIDADQGVESINIISPEGVAAGTYTGSLTYGALSTNPMVLKLDQKVCFGISVPDIAQAQTNTSIIDTVTQEAKKGIEAAIDAYLFGLSVNVDAENVLGTTGTPVVVKPSTVYGQFVALAKMLKVSGALSGQNAGWAVVHPDVEEKLLLCSQFASASNLGEKTVSTGAIGKIAGLDVFVSNNVGKTGTKYTVMAGTNRAVTYASQLTNIETVRAQNSFDSLVRGLYTFGGLVVQPKAMAVMTCTLADG